MSAYWEYTLSFAVGWAWGYEAAAVSPLLGYWIWQSAPNRFVFSR